jgi:dihydrofolate reductase
VRHVRYNVAASLDGFIADAEGRYDWIPLEPGIDFGALFARVDTVLLGRRSYELTLRDPAARTWPEGARLVVFSRTLSAADHPEVTIVADDAAGAVAAMRREQGGDIWLYGGGELFATLLAAGQVDSIEVTVIPILLGAGVPLLPSSSTRVPLRLVESRVWPSGQVSLHYAHG